MTTLPTPPGTDSGPLEPLFSPLEAALLRLHAELEDRARFGDDLDLVYTTLDSPIGPLLVAATDQGLCRVAFSVEGHDSVLNDLSEQVGARILKARRRLDTVAEEIDDYFEGRRTVFDIPVDLRLSSGFRRRVLEHLRGISFGTTESYSQVAAAVGNPKAVRAAGSACATNPVPLIVPCHRVVRSDGTYGAYRGGPAAKHLLLTMEAASRGAA